MSKRLTSMLPFALAIKNLQLFNESLHAWIYSAGYSVNKHFISTEFVVMWQQWIIDTEISVSIQLCNRSLIVRMSQVFFWFRTSVCKNGHTSDPIRVPRVPNFLQTARFGIVYDLIRNLLDRLSWHLGQFQTRTRYVNKQILNLIIKITR